MFALLNPTTFKYFIPFLILYVLLIVGRFVFFYWVKKQPKDSRRLYRKSFGYLAEACMWIGLLGLVYLGARRYSVYFLSMEFLHVLNGIILIIFLVCGLDKYKKLSSK